MNRGVLQSSPVQQMVAAGNPNWWSINNMMRPPPPPPPPPSHHYQPTSPFLPPPPNIFPPFVPSSSSSSSSSIPMPCWYDKQEQLPESWSQLLLCGLVVGDEDNKGVNNMGQFQAAKKLEQWEEEAQQQVLNLQVASSSPLEHVKQENSASCYVYGGHACHGHDQDFQAAAAAKASGCWSHMMTDPCASSSSPNKSCVSTTSNMLDFSSNKGGGGGGDCRGRHPPPDRSSECDGIATGGTLKKARVQPSSTQSTFKVRKEKLGDRITALHQLVSPFGKTDTASVLLEAIGYIRFLQSQIQALSLPYLGSGSSPNNIKQHPQSVQGGGERNCIFPEDPGQLLNDNCIKRKGPSDHQDTLEEPKKDLRSRGLCLVPISCTLQVGNDNGADFWAPALGGGFR